jgi:hypothetical protein
MDILALVVRKQNEADVIAADIAARQADLNARLAVVDRLHQLQIQSVFTVDEVTFLFTEQTK